MANPIAQAFAKKSLVLPGSGFTAPMFRFRNFAGPASVWLFPLTPSITLTKAWVSTLNRSGPEGEAAMFGR